MPLLMIAIATLQDFYNNFKEDPTVKIPWVSVIRNSVASSSSMFAGPLSCVCLLLKAEHSQSAVRPCCSPCVRLASEHHSTSSGAKSGLAVVPRVSRGLHLQAGLQVRRDLCSPRVLVMEWINGMRCTDPAGIRASGIDVNEFIRNGVVSALRQLLEVLHLPSAYCTSSEGFQLEIISLCAASAGRS